MSVGLVVFSIGAAVAASTTDRSTPTPLGDAMRSPGLSVPHLLAAHHDGPDDQRLISRDQLARSERVGCGDSSPAPSLREGIAGREDDHTGTERFHRLRPARAERRRGQQAEHEQGGPAVRHA